MGEEKWISFLRIKGGGWSSSYHSVDLLLKHLSRKSRSVASRQLYCSTLYKFCLETGKNPDELVIMGEDRIEQAIQAFADKAFKGNNPRTPNRIIACLRAFFRCNGLKGTRELQLQTYRVPARNRARPEYVPTLEESFKMANCCGSLRNRAIILTLVSTGLRNSTLRAVKYGEGNPDPEFCQYIVKRELEKGMENLAIMVYPEMKKTVPRACKNKIPYYVFTCHQATEAIKDYLRERIGKYGSIADDEPLFCSEFNLIKRRQRKQTTLSGRQLANIVKNATRKAGIEHWAFVTPHSLRKTFDRVLRNQQAEVRLDTKDQEFFMGHLQPGSQEAYYDETKVEKMRQKYSKMVFEPSSQPIRKTVQRIIAEEELAKYLAEGWHFDAALPSGRVIVSKIEG